MDRILQSFRNGQDAKGFIESEHSITPTIVVSEISRKLRKDIELGNETHEGRLRRLEFIPATSRILDLDFEIAIEAGGISLKYRGLQN